MEETILNGEVLAAEEDETGTYFLLLSVVVVVVLLAVAYFWKSGSDSSSKRSSASSSFSSSSSSSSSGLKTSGGVGLNRSNSKLGAEDLAGRPTLKVFWGSQTGTAEDFAQGLCDEAKKLGFNPQSIDLEDYDKEDLENEERAIFVMATYGEGEPTDNAKEFYEWIMDESLDSEMLSSLKFSVFGLGNRTYEHYNAIGRAMDSRLEALGATRIYDRGEGDDDSSLEEDFMNWKKDLWGPFCKAAGLPPPGNMQNDTVAPRLKMVVLKDVPAEQQLHALGTLKPGLTYDLKNPYIAEVVVNRELHKPSSDRSCRHIEFHVGEATSLKYEPGDHLGVYAHNSAAMVEALAERLNIQQLDQVIALYPINATDLAKTKPVLGPCTVRTVLTQLRDITNPPRKSVLQALAQYASDPEEKKRLLTLASTDESSLPKEQQYAQWIKQDRRCVLEILEAFPSLQPPLDHFLEILPDLAPRYYSISSSPSLHPDRIHITSVVVDYETPTGRLHNGVASNHFLRLIPRSKEDEEEEDGGSETQVKLYSAPIYVRKSTFRLPRKLETPIIMVGPGTGLAPFRGFIQERQHLAAKKGVKGGEVVLYFGCRNRNMDYIYEEELAAMAEEGTITHLRVAFSREQDEKEYVQHKIKADSKLIWDLLHNKGAHFYICGDAWRMAPDVKNTVEDILVEEGGMTREQAQQYITKLQEDNRWSTDVWF